MATRIGLILAAGVLLVTPAAPAQPPGRGGGRSEDAATFVKRMMAFDANKDGKLTRDEITDPRLLRLFDRADANHDGVVTPEELTALFERENRGGGGRGPGGPGGGRGGPGAGPGGSGGGGPLGMALPPFAADQLRLTDEQRRQVAELQKEVEARLEKILTASQKERLREMRGPGGPPGGPPEQ